MKKLCVGIDVAKNKFDVCFTIDGENYFGHSVFSNSKHGLKDLVTLSKKYKKEFKVDKIHFCMEATGIFLKLFSLKPVIHIAKASVHFGFRKPAFLPYTISLPLRAL